MQSDLSHCGMIPDMMSDVVERWVMALHRVVLVSVCVNLSLALVSKCVVTHIM